jgi:hypothetical protein
LPRPPRPAGAAQAIFFDLRGLTDSPEMGLVLVALAFLRQAVIQAELFVPPRLLAPILRPVPWGTIPRRSNALWGPHARSQRFACALVPDGFVRNTWMGLDGCPCLHAQSRWPVFPDGLSCLIFLRPPSPASLHAFYLESVFEEIARACSDMQIRPLLTLVLTGPNGRIDGMGVTAFYQVDVITICRSQDNEVKTWGNCPAARIPPKILRYSSTSISG